LEQEVAEKRKKSGAEQPDNKKRGGGSRGRGKFLSNTKWARGVASKLKKSECRTPHPKKQKTPKKKKKKRKKNLWSARQECP